MHTVKWALRPRTLRDGSNSDDLLCPNGRI